MKLYEIPAQYRQALEACQPDEETGELDESTVAALSAFLADSQDKIEASALFVRELEAEAELVAQESQAMAARSKSIKRHAERIKAFMLPALEVLGGKVKAPRVTVSLRTSKAVEVADENALPEAFKQEVVTVKIDKIKIKDAITAGQEVPGACIVERKSVQMRVK